LESNRTAMTVEELPSSPENHKTGSVRVT
jgi:hypothetical protein